MAKDPNGPKAPYVLSRRQVVELAHAAGFRGEDLAIAVAISQAESGFDAHNSLVNTYALGARGRSVGSIDRGLMQINSVWHPTLTDDQAYDARQNMEYAFQLYKRNGMKFTPWVTYTGGHHTRYLAAARAEAQAYDGNATSVYLPDQAPISTVPTPSVNGDVGVARGTSVVGADHRLADIWFGEGKLAGNLARAVIGPPTIDLSSSESSQMEMTLLDPGFFVTGLAGGWKLGTPMRYHDMRMELEAVSTSGGVGIPQVKLVGRSAGIRRLRQATGEHIVTNMSPTQYAQTAAFLSGLRFVGEGSAVQPNISRSKDENTWDVIRKLAGELGFISFESTGTIYFARPSWLMTRPGAKRHIVRWPAGHGDPKKLTSLTVPRLERSDANDAAASGSITLRHAAGIQIRPADVITLEGIPGFEGDYLVTNVPITVDGHSPVTISFETPVDPEPGAETNEGVVDGLEGINMEDMPPLLDDGGGAAPPYVRPGTTLMGTFREPIHGNFRISSGYRTPSRPTHKGIDQGVPIGTPVRAIGDGVVEANNIQAGGAGWGKYVRVRHRDDVRSLYAHLSKFHRSIGETVRQGEIIGFSGNTGKSTGPHLHLEVHAKQAGPGDWDTQNPINWMNPEVNAKFRANLAANASVGAGQTR